MSKNRFAAVPSVYILFKKDDKVLLGIRQNTPWMNGWYGLVSGHTEDGESVINSTIREGYEEAGVTISPKQLKLSSVMYRHMDRTNVDFFFVCEEWQGEIQNKEPHKCIGWEWFEKDSLPDNTIDYLKIAIKHSFETDACGFFEIGF